MARPPAVGPGDVRMRGFLERGTIAEALAVLRPLVRVIGTEPVPLADALGRILAADVKSGVDVPSFAKSAVDGYGVHAEEGFGASGANPIGFALVGQILPGQLSEAAVASGQAVRIMTGGPIPAGVDAVVMAERAEERGHQVFLSEAVPPGKNVVTVGEDIRRGDTVLRAGRRLRPHDLGVLASVGVAAPVCRRRPRVAVATTGNELVPPEEMESRPGAVVNSNTYVIEGLARSLGAEPLPCGIVADEMDDLRRLVQEFPGDILVTTGGTSVGQEDFLPVVVAEVGEMLVHGLSMRPASPSGFGLVGSRLVFLLPGNPVAAAVGFDVLVRPCLQWMLGTDDERPHPRLRVPLARKVASGLNRVDFVRVKLGPEGAEPLRAGAGALSSMSRADGFIIVASDLEGIDAGEEVEVLLW